MSVWIIPPCPGLIEPSPAPEIYIDGIGAVQCTGRSLRIACYANEICLYGAGPQRVVKFWVRRPLSQTSEILTQNAVIKAFMMQREAPPEIKRPRLVT